MIKVENVDIWGFEHAIRGMRNPMNSWDRSDTIYGEFHGLDDNGREILVPYNPPNIGENDLALMQKLYKAGKEHRKYLRQIFVSMDITAPLYWWKEFDTYKIGTVSNSCSTMHKIHSKEFTLDDFSHEHLFGEFEPIERLTESDLVQGDNLAQGHKFPINTKVLVLRSDTILLCIIMALNFYREKYIETKDKNYWWQIIQLLPTSYNQKRTITMNYENVLSIIHQRTGHKLDEWNEFCEILKELPYIKEIME